ncbi:MAG: branched-chain amino acid transport system permease protein [Pseudonocardiales bacterium]|nr:branched-chain amino acid transport system permease protein [Pseudonocardiales bacterium]
MEKFVALTFSGLSLGAIYTLVSLGILIMYKATGVVNAAQFGLVALGGYVGFWATKDLNLPLGVGYLVVIVAMGLVGLVLERLAYAPLRNRPPDTVLLSTLAGGFAIEGIIVLWQGPQLRSLGSPVGFGTTKVLGAPVFNHSLLIIGLTIGGVALLGLLFTRTSFGRQVRALAADRDTARLQGIAVNRLSLITFALSSAIAGIAGVLLAPATALTPDMGFTPMLFAFGAAIIGGFGRLTGVVLGSVVLGLVEQWGGGYLSSSVREAFPFIAILLVIALRPEGLFRGELSGRL